MIDIFVHNSAQWWCLRISWRRGSARNPSPKRKVIRPCTAGSELPWVNTQILKLVWERINQFGRILLTMFLWSCPILTKQFNKTKVHLSVFFLYSQHSMHFMINVFILTSKWTPFTLNYVLVNTFITVNCWDYY